MSYRYTKQINNDIYWICNQLTKQNQTNTVKITRTIKTTKYNYDKPYNIININKLS